MTFCLDFDNVNSPFFFMFFNHNYIAQSQRNSPIQKQTIICDRKKGMKKLEKSSKKLFNNNKNLNLAGSFELRYLNLNTAVDQQLKTQTNKN